MQTAFDFAAEVAGDDIGFMRDALGRFFGTLEPFRRRSPVWQLVRSLISAQTYDTVTEAALKRLIWRWPDPAGMADADAKTVLRYMDDVTHARAKAEQLVATLQWIGRERPGYDLSFLCAWPVRDALDWLERFPGVGPKVAAATLNASTLARPVFIVDSHVHRILLRFSFVGPPVARHARAGPRRRHRRFARCRGAAGPVRPAEAAGPEGVPPVRRPLRRLPARRALPAEDRSRPPGRGTAAAIDCGL